ncbi:MAG: hypothetical protein LBK98_11255 [Peptococcaceae bacterium]|jgi:DNA polymerase-3 subunit delta'|nr:hypothetical protein [Peptococcaceae bacterium]
MAVLPKPGQKTAHAYILRGGDKDFLLAEARRLAAGLNCLAADGADRPCGSCENCRHLAAGTFRDWFAVAPQGAAELIQIRQIRGLQADLAGKPAQGRVKIAVLIDAHRMREESQNSLLKTLEEPPGDTVLLLLTDQPQALLPTVRSRCQMVDCGSSVALPPMADLELARDTAAAIAKGGYFAVFERAAFVAKSRKKQLPVFFTALELLLRNALLAGWQNLEADDRTASGLLGGKKEILAALELTWRAGYLLERNVGGLLVLENLFLGLARLGIGAEEKEEVC